MEDIKTLLGQAIRSEIDAAVFYNSVADAVRNLLLKERMRFLAQEEKKHEAFLRRIYEHRFPGEEIIVPETTPVPSPSFEPSENTQFSQLFSEAMEAEKAAHDFYMQLASRFSGEHAQILKYLAMMEMGHYQILETEREMALNVESYENYDPGIHMGV